MDDVGWGDVELVAQVLGGDRLGTAAAVLEHFGDVPALARADGAEVQQITGIGPTLAGRLHAAFALGRRALDPPSPHRPSIVDAPTAFQWLGPGLRGLAHEELHALYLDRRRRPLAVRALSRGSDRYTVVDPRQVYRPAVALSASGVILAHNHPSGDRTPSSQDREVTRRVAQAGQVLGIPLLDHLVVGDQGFTSLAAEGLLGTPTPLAACWTS